MKQVLTVGQMHHLQELGVDTSRASMMWQRSIYNLRGETRYSKWYLHFNPHSFRSFQDRERVDAFTLQDILELLPKEIKDKCHGLIYHLNVIYPNDDLWKVSYIRNYSVLECFICETLIDAAYEMLCWVVENGYLNKED